MSTAPLDDSVSLTCARCQGRFRVRSRSALRPGATSTCGTCGARFHVLAHPRPLDPVAALSPHDAPPPAIEPAVGTQPSRGPSPQVHKPRFLGAGGSLFGMHVVNVCLTIVTLSIYSFWAKVRVRRYLYSQTQFAGDRFAYHGTGQELLNGASKATLVFGLPYMVLSNAPLVLGGGGPVFWVTQVLSTLVVLVFLPVAIIGARRYRLSRSSWRGIRFSFRGKAVPFITLFVKGALLTGLTLGAYYPVFDLKRQAHLVNHSYIGNQSFSFDGEDWGLATTFVCSTILIPLTLGLSWFWYLAARQRYVWNHTSLGNARFACTMQGWPLAKLRIGNVLLLAGSLGLAWPWTTVRNARFTMSTLSLKGLVDVDGILQDTQSASTTGEGLSGFLDGGFDLG